MELDGKQPDATPSGISPHETQCLYKGRKEGGPPVNQRTGEAIKIKASKTVRFSPAKALKESL